jgi:Tol biopolymer transport system component
MLLRHSSFALIALGACAAWLKAEPSGPQPASSPQRWTPAAVSTEQYESSPTFTPDGREMYFMSADRQFRNYRLMLSRCVDGAWARAEPVPFGAAAPVIEADPHVTWDGRRLYFVSSRQAPQREDFDIWYVDRQPDGSWGEPRRLPAPVNSSYSELLPRTDRAGRLFFGSARPGGFGQSDIYMATQGADGRWSVENVGPPVSTSADEYEAEVSADGQTMVVVADRGDRSHLYRFERRNERWADLGRLPGAADVFQVGPILSPAADRLLFAQADPKMSGEIFLVDIEERADRSWPPCSGAATRPGTR